MSGEHQEAIALEAEKTEQRKKLNGLFRDGCFAFEPEMVKLLARVEFPIVVDLNNVLISNNQPLEVNPEAKKFLNDLAELGEIFVVTTANNWETVWRRLEQNGLSDKIVLMVAENYFKPREEWTRSQRAVIDTYIAEVLKQGLAEEFGLQEQLAWKELRVKPEVARRLRFSGSAANKRLAPLFSKPFAVPIIDDAYEATSDNPGMRGFLAPCFEPHPKKGRGLEKLNTEHQSLKEIGAAVKKYKDSIR